MMEIIGKCPMPASHQSLMYYKGKYASKKLNAAYELAQEVYRGNVSAAMCSDNPHGIFSVYQAFMLISAKRVPHKSPEKTTGLVSSRVV